MDEETQPKIQTIVPLEFKVPLKMGVKSKKVLTEDEFSQGISKIIERDFFPDIPRLHTQTEYLEALEKNDLVKLREIQIKFNQQNVQTTDLVSGTPATFETPDGGRKTTPANPGQGYGENAIVDTSEHDVDGGQARIECADKSTPQLSLDSFLAKNTSEDSSSFVEILAQADTKHRMKHAWLFDKEKEQQREHEDMLVVPSVEQQAAAAVTNRSATHINTWKYTNKNAVMYVPEGVDLSGKELIEQQKHKPREIIHENTRFQYNPFSNSKSKEAMQKAASFRALINQGKIGHDGKEVQGAQSVHVNGYGFVGSASPDPGVAESPVMTWGEIESTPARLDTNIDALVSSTPGPVFRIPAVPKRDRLALELSQKASQAHRDKKEEAIKQVTRRFVSPTSSPSSCKVGVSSAERLSSMSPAAQRLASKRLGIQTSTDKALQASYSPSPSRQLSGTSTPVRLSPASRRSRRSLSASPAVSTPAAADSATDSAQETSLTDHLLILPKRTRKSAADFF